METVIHNGLTYKMGAHNKPYYFDTLRKDWIRDVGVSGEFISRLLNIRKGVESLTSMPESTLGLSIPQAERALQFPPQLAAFIPLLPLRSLVYPRQSGP